MDIHVFTSVSHCILPVFICFGAFISIFGYFHLFPSKNSINPLPPVPLLHDGPPPLRKV